MTCRGAGFRRKLAGMKHFAPAAALALPLLFAACASAERPYAPVEDVRFTALGHDPFWMATVGDDSIVLTLGPEGALNEQRWPRTLPRTDGGVTRWESGDGTAVISIEARPGPCTGSRGAVYEHHATVRLSGRELSGCGGRRLAKGRG